MQSPNPRERISRGPQHHKMNKILKNEENKHMPPLPPIYLSPQGTHPLAHLRPPPLSALLMPN